MHVFPAFLTPALTQLLLRATDYFLTWLKAKSAIKKVRFDQKSTFQPPIYKSDMFTTNNRLGCISLKYRFMQFFNPSPNKPLLLRVCSTSLLKTLWEKEKLLEKSNLSFSYSVFYLFGELSAIFIRFKIVICKLFQFGKV